MIDFFKYYYRNIFFKVFFLLLFNSKCFSQKICSFNDNSDNIDYYYNTSSYQYDNLVANEIVRNILNKINVSNDYFIVKSIHGEENCYAVYLNGYKYIFIDNNWIDEIKSTSGDWFYLFALSHEIAHHLLGHTTQKNTSLEQQRLNELNADRFAGVILAKYGAPLNSINNIFNKIPNPDLKSDHPQNEARVRVVKEAYFNEVNKIENKLLIDIIKGSYFTKDDFVMNINNCRDRFYNYLESANYDNMDNLLGDYENLIRLNKNIDIIYELSMLYLINLNYDKYLKALEFSYVSIKDSLSLVRLIGFGGEDHYKKFTSKYPEVFSFDKYRGDNLELCVELANLFLLMNRYSDERDETGYLEAAEDLLIHSKKIIENNDNSSENDKILSKYFESAGVISMRKQDFYSACKYLYKAEKIIQEEYDKEDISYNLDLLSSMIFTYNSNLLEACLKLNDYKTSKICIDKCDNVLINRNSLIENTEPKEYVGRFFYLKALYLFNTNNDSQACEFLSKSCDLGQISGCDKLKILCQ
jgi:Zn-dependent peptidase ImmA (M78 family)